MLPDKAAFCDSCGTPCGRNEGMPADTSGNYEMNVLSHDKSFDTNSETNVFDKVKKAVFGGNGENEQKVPKSKNKAIKISVAVLTALVVAVIILFAVLHRHNPRMYDDSMESNVELRDNKEYHYDDANDLDYVVILNDLGEPQEFDVYYGIDEVQEKYKPLYDENNTVIGIVAYIISDKKIVYYEYEPELYSMELDLHSNLPLRYNMTREEYYTDSSYTEISYYFEHVFEVNGSEYIDNVTRYDQDGTEVGYWRDECDRVGDIK